MVHVGAASTGGSDGQESDDADRRGGDGGGGARRLFRRQWGGDSSRRRHRRRRRQGVHLKLVAAEYSKDNTAAWWKQCAEKYQAKTGTTLEVQIVSWEAIDQQVSTMIQNNNAPDNLNVYASYAKDKLLYSPDEVLSPAARSDLLDAFVKSGSYEGKMYGK